MKEIENIDSLLELSKIMSGCLVKIENLLPKAEVNLRKAICEELELDRYLMQKIIMENK